MICLDTCAIIDFLKMDSAVIKAIGNINDNISTTEISVHEVFLGIYLKGSQKEITSTKQFMDSIEILPFDMPCGRESARIEAGLYRDGLTIEQNDCMIAACMLKHGCSKILTRNRKHFERIKGIKAVEY
ncbi:type II toxin-antitoxin system VapC family toxin [Candidatus Woesearchaeota archaeon]|nr:type II toxin-antitoxin system VapC family toxin [Candidatus Woesearchaeota archaeon]